MKNSLKFASVVAAGLIFVGCNKKEEPTTPPPPPPAQSTSNGITGALNNAASNAQSTTSNALTNAKANAQAQMGNASSAMNDQTSKTLDQVKTYVADKKYDLADAALKPVEARKASLPETLQTEVANLREQIDAGKAAAK
jgi:hypothetical protein